MEQWVVVLDSDKVSRTQLEICKAVRPPLQGMVRCDLDKNRDAAVCAKVDYFPAFCNTSTSECVYGLRRTLGDFTDLPESGSSQRTKDPAPSPEETK